jgi:hypothetical protein
MSDRSQPVSSTAYATAYTDGVRSPTGTPANPPAPGSTSSNLGQPTPNRVAVVDDHPAATFRLADIPEDIQHIIVEHLWHTDDGPSSVAALSLVSHTFRALGLRALFRSWTWFVPVLAREYVLPGVLLEERVRRHIR